MERYKHVLSIRLMCFLSLPLSSAIFLSLSFSLSLSNTHTHTNHNMWVKYVFLETIKLLKRSFRVWPTYDMK